MEKFGKPRVVQYDFVRAIAMLMVLVFHYSTTLEQYKVQGFINFGLNYANGRLGSVGVAIFFMLSGACLYMQTCEEEKLNLKKFFIKRWSSIYPQYYFYYLIALICMALFYPSFFIGKDPYTIVQTILGIDGYIHYYYTQNFYLIGEWFLGALVLLYLLFPLYRISVRKSTVLMATVAWFTFLVNLKYSPLQMDKFNQLLTCQLFFIVGMIYEKERQHIGARIKVACAIILAIMLFVNIPINLGVPLHPVLAVVICAIPMFVVLCEIGSQVGNWKVFRFLAKNSYGYFLFHHIFIFYGIRPFANRVFSVTYGGVILLLYLLVSIGIATLLNQAYYLIKTVYTRVKMVTRSMRQ